MKLLEDDVTEKTTQSTLTVIATRLPYIDRRSLSQAWLSSLHLASDGRPARSQAERRGTPGSDPLVRAAVAERATVAKATTVPSRARTIATRANVSGAELATRRTFDARAAAASRATFQRARSYPPFRSSLTLAVANERVQLLMRRDGATLHVVAVCRAEIAETVRRALAAADAHLRVRGDAVRSSVEVAGSKVRA